MSRIKTLLQKYKTKQPGEIWTKEHEREAMRDWRTKQRLRIVDTLSTQHNILKYESDRMKFLITKLDFALFGQCNEEDIIVMLLVFVKSTSYNFYKYDYILQKHEISCKKYANFITNVCMQLWLHY